MSPSPPLLSVIIPANNEQAFIGPCLDAVLAQDIDLPFQVVVAANGCTDRTAEIAQGYADRFAARNVELTVLDIAEGGKPNALDRADDAALTGMRAYLDADVRLGPAMLSQLLEALSVPEPRYASGRLVVAPAESWVTRHFARVWQTLPFMTDGVPGAGLFAVNAAGRARWERFPQIISDDTYVRLLFTPEERLGVAEAYSWPMVEGWAGLVRVRRRQDAGVAEISRLWPEMMRREGKAPVGTGGTLRRFLRMPVSMSVYIAILLTVRFGPGRTSSGWARGR